MSLVPTQRPLSLSRPHINTGNGRLPQCTHNTDNYTIHPPPSPSHHNPSSHPQPPPPWWNTLLSSPPPFIWFCFPSPSTCVSPLITLHSAFVQSRTAFLASSVLPAEQVSGGYNIRDESDEVSTAHRERLEATSPPPLLKEHISWCFFFSPR